MKTKKIILGILVLILSIIILFFINNKSPESQTNKNLSKINNVENFLNSNMKENFLAFNSDFNRLKLAYNQKFESRLKELKNPYTKINPIIDFYHPEWNIKKIVWNKHEYNSENHTMISQFNIVLELSASKKLPGDGSNMKYIFNTNDIIIPNIYIKWDTNTGTILNKEELSNQLGWLYLEKYSDKTNSSPADSYLKSESWWLKGV